MTFRDQACAHLTDYRQRVLGIQQAGTFRFRGVEHPKGHVLPRHEARSNLLAPYGERFFVSEHRDIQLHRFFHHLNSSQALCINLFYPLLAEGHEALLARALATDQPPPFQAVFEAESALEVAQRRTSFDFQLRSASGHEVYVEVKYTEDGFGGAKADEEHRRKFQQTYAPLLQGSPFLTDVCKDESFFLQHYQILRNLVHITASSEVRFVIPRANRKVAQQAAHAREQLLTPQGQARFQVVYLEDLVPDLIAACQGSPLGAHYQAFAHKYLAFLR